ncbi:M20 family metallopeptidase [Rhodospirillaceae bacterium KN72]|uniref:M20 family metallopeptidase n=1 Tax=Pacificispira spongiicola TaxID=2729598 RepID=A0A7Y0E3K6_9PROT|nr:hypothetical protein [Pacificispira spongiicola]NMM46573.1 M20 family metallopeptidase [Pacificispira spongiicola]
MTTRGRKPKAPELRLIEGSHRSDRHGDPNAIKAGLGASKSAFGPVERPKGMKGEALKAWKQYIEPAFWLDASREPSAIAFCELWAEFRAIPSHFPAARHTQMRAYMSELGLTDLRNRPAPGETEKDPFFDD